MLLRFLGVAILLGCLVLSTVSLLAISAHLDLAAHALAVMALQTPRSQQDLGQSAPGIVPAVAGAPEAEARFSLGSVPVGEGTELVVIEDQAARVLVYIVKGPGGMSAPAVVRLPDPDGCEDESLDDTGLREARVRG